MECGICLIAYEPKNPDRYPLFLECGHTFCKICVKDLLSVKPLCPLCRSKITKKFDDLKTNFALLDILSQKASQLSPVKQSNFKKSDIYQNNSNFKQGKKLISEMPKITDTKVLKTFDKFGPYLENIEDPETCDLPYEGPYQFENGVVYMGQMKNEMREGLGIQVWPDGSRYEGIWLNNKANKKGRLIYSDGDFNFGDWKDDKKFGKGKFVHFDGAATYEGEWNDEKHGFGNEKWLDGAFYQGEYKNGQKSGKGKFHWADGSVLTEIFLIIG